MISNMRIGPLLQTKLYIPQIPPDLVSRPGLLARLSQGMAGKLTLVSAPAGFGKTISLVAWIRTEKIPFAWITLDENDNDIGRFLAYLIAGLATIPVPIDDQLLSLFRSREEPIIEGVIIPLINQILTSDQRFGLVLDDYHLIQHQEIHILLAYLLEHLPPNMHLVISTRADPPLNLAKLRARGQINEIRASHLRFSVEEANRLLNQLRGLNLTMEDLEGLISRTDGWIAGLQMVSIALEGKNDPAQYIRDFSGNQEYVADYLTTEVFARQTASIQQFLMKTSILDRFCASLCDALTDQGSGRQILKYIKKKNLFLVSLDDENQWFCYHRLFADLNHQRLLESQADELPTYYQKASGWFEAHGSMPEAIEYAFRGNLTVRAASLIEVEAEPTLIRSEIATFVRWVEKLPEDILCNKGILCIYFAWALIVSGDEYRRAAFYLGKVNPDDEPTLGRVNAVKAMILVHQRDIKEAIRLAKLALNLLPEEDYFFRQVAAWNLSALLFISGDTVEGAHTLEEVARVSLASDNLLVAIIALCRLGAYRYQQGDLSLAKDLFERAIEIQPAHQSQPVPAACEAMLGLGRVYWERAEFDTASRYLQEGLQLRKNWRAVSDVDSIIVLAYIHQYLGDVGRANQLIEDVKQLVVQNAATDTGEKYVASHQALIHLRQGNHPAVESWVSERKFVDLIRDLNLDNLDDLGKDIVLRYELIVYARYLLANHQVDKALGLLANLLPSIERLGHQSKIIEIQVLMALGFQAIGKIDEAAKALNAGLVLAERDGYKRIFFEEGPSMAGLIKIALVRGYDSQFAREILADLKGEPSDDSGIREGIALIDPLSDREIEVLRMLDSELSVPEIADGLYIAVSTLRTHVRNIYRKLGVHSRLEAVLEGKDLNII